MNFFKKQNKTNLSNFIYVKKDALPKSFCSNVIEKFEKDDRKHQGVVANGVSLNMKRSLDLQISQLDDWETFDQGFYRSLNSELNNYHDFIPDIFNLSNIRLVGDDTGYQIQRTQPGDFYNWHHDFVGTRILTFIWYLNDIKHNGYTEFIDGTKIQPETGKFVMFPATWNYMHRGVSPKDETKYICTGWIHSTDDYSKNKECKKNQKNNQKKTQKHQWGM